MDLFSVFRIVFWVFFAVIAASLILIMLRRTRRQQAEKPVSNLRSGDPYKVSGIVWGKDMNNPRIVWYSPADQEGHGLVIGGTGTGKTADILIPSLRAWFRGSGTSIVVDLSGDIAKNCPSDNTLIWDPEDPECPPYDILWLIDREEDYREQDILLEAVAKMIVQDPPASASSAEKYYAETAQEIFLAGFITLYDEGYDIVPICKMLSANIFDQILSLVESDPQRPHYQWAHTLIASKRDENPTNISGAMSAMVKALKPYATNPYLTTVLRRPDAEDYTSVNAGTCQYKNLFVRIKEERTIYYGSMLGLLVQQAFYCLKSRKNAENKVLFALDEFTAFGKIDITDALARLRKRGVRVMVLTQSLADLDAIYGEKERIRMLDNYDSIAVLRATDASSQKYFSDLVGTYEKINTTRTRGASFLTYRETTLSDSETREKLIQPEDFARLGDTLILLHRGGWMRLKKNHYWEGKQPAALPEPEPELPPPRMYRDDAAEEWYKKKDEEEARQRRHLRDAIYDPEDPWNREDRDNMDAYDIPPEADPDPDDEESTDLATLFGFYENRR